MPKCLASLLATACLALSSAPSRAEGVEGRTVQLSAAQFLALGQRAATEGDLAAAVAIYRALTKDPASAVRSEAHFRLARLLADQGKLAQAAVELRRVVDEQPSAGAVRIGLAQLLDRMGDIDGARRQLRAAQAAGLPRELALFGERYANSLRSRAPYGWSVEVAIAPDSNINRATRSDTLATVIGDFQVNPDSKARSGIGVAVAGSAFVRANVAPNLALVGRVQGNADRYREREFNRLNLSASAGAELSLGPARLTVDAGGGRSEFGGEPYQDFMQLSARGYHPIGTRMAVTATAMAAKINNRVNDLQDGRSLMGGLAIDRALSPQAGLQLSLTGNRFSAADPGYSTRSWEVGLGGWLDVGRWTLTAAVAHGKLKADERLVLFPERRMDTTKRLSVGVHARAIQLLGFSPLARFTIERNHSNIEIWDYRRRRFELGARRAF